ncbi:glycosyltransferase [Geodermatophilus saharensis]|uniref:glycosyltransferase n=1 Tax=Geodermatophilus saharensis TaxID=1137994 RepID=UPI0011406EED|nr:glycosyltransferase [Geodermatophilus saharensis]
MAGADLLGVPRARLARQERATLRGADAVAAVSPVLAERLAEGGRRVHLVPNGCAPEAYADVDDAPLPTDVSLRPPVAGFVGFLNDRIELTLLEAVADAGISLLLVGPQASGHRSDRVHALAARPNVCWVGARAFEELPGYLRLIDVGLTPYADTAFNRASFPLKTLEYLAAGRPVVSTPLPATEWLDTDLIRTAIEPADFAAQVVALSTSGRIPEQVRARRAFAGSHSWAARAEALEALLSLQTSVEVIR